MYKTVRISDFLHRRKVPVDISPNEEYSLVTIKLYHKGVVLREKKLGSQLGSTMFKISKGQFILSGIDARNGAFGIVPDSLDGAIITNDFWCFDVDETVMKRDFFYWLTNTPLFLNACIKASKGETQRVRLQKDLFFDFEFQIPSLDEQGDFLKRIEVVDIELGKLENSLSIQLKYFSDLRQSILREAIEGKLTVEWRQQNLELISGENHASKLLEKIRAEKARLIKEGKIKKGKPVATTSDDKTLFALPDSWVWGQLGEIARFIDYRGKTPHKINSGVRLITAKNVKMGFLSLQPEEFISEKEYAHRMTRGFPQKGDIFFTTEAPLGNVCLNSLDEKISMGQRIITISPIQMDSKFLMYQMMSSWIQKEIYSRKSGMTAQGIKSARLVFVPIAIPSLNEQNAIVKRVDTLMAMVDELEKQGDERKAQSELLMQSVLREAFEQDSADLQRTVN